jgi:hypothetical protein
VSEATDETNITEIELMPDGRIFLFGTSLEVLELLEEMQTGLDSALALRLAAMRKQSGHADGSRRGLTQADPPESCLVIVTCEVDPDLQGEHR